MRDNSFGNFISTLRMRKGLSQYQLGVLVGVSDKAVSKWENGASKPRINTIIKLAEEKMKGIYGDKPPIRITNRFKSEQLMIEENDILLWMGFMGKLKEMFNNDDLSFELRTAQIGASFIAWLLGGTDVNPLPAHYYCPTGVGTNALLARTLGLILSIMVYTFNPYRSDNYATIGRAA